VMKLEGDYKAGKILQYSDAKDGYNRVGCFGTHMLTSGIFQLDEGTTISAPIDRKFPLSPKWNQQISEKPRIELLGTSSENIPAMMFADVSGKESSPCGRLVIDPGCTKFFKANMEGIPRYASNMTIWLTGLDYKIAHRLENWPAGLTRLSNIRTPDYSDLFPPAQIILAIDFSGSMVVNDGDKSTKTTARRIDAVFDALKEFFDQRLRIKAESKSDSTVTDDLISVVFFNHAATVVAQQRTLNESFVKTFMANKYEPSGGTSFVQAFKGVFTCLEKANVRPSGPSPLLLFLSDGVSNDDSITAFQTLVQAFPTLEVDFVMYGNDPGGERQLEELTKHHDSKKARVKRAVDGKSLAQFLLTSFIGRIR